MRSGAVRHSTVRFGPGRFGCVRHGRHDAPAKVLGTAYRNESGTARRRGPARQPPVMRCFDPASYRRCVRSDRRKSSASSLTMR